MCELIDRALARDPGARYASADDMVFSLREVRARLVTSGSSPAAIATAQDVGNESTRVDVASQPRLEARVVSTVLARLGDHSGKAPLQMFERIAAGLGGSTSPLLGGHAVAIFGRGNSVGEEAQRAVRCGLSVARAIGGLDVAVVTSRVWSAEGSMRGDSIDRGARLLERASGRVMVDDVTVRLVGDGFDAVPDGDAFVLSTRGADAGAPRFLGRETPLVGRDRQLRLLEGLWEECTEDTTARLALVTGPAGSGKSRLPHEFVRRAKELCPEAAIWIARANPVGAGSPYALLGDALRSALGPHDSDRADLWFQRLRARLGMRLPADECERIARELSDLLGARSDDTAFESGALRRDLVLRGDRVRLAIGRWLDAETRSQPVLLVIEDLHWGDSTSTDILDGVLAVMPHRPLMVLALARPELSERFPRLWIDRPLTTVNLPELHPRAALRLVSAVLPELPEGRLVAIVERAGGNAFFLEELVRCVAEGRGDELPDTVLGVIQSRFDALTEPSRRLVGRVSVFGRIFWRAAARSLTGHTDAALDGMLRELVSAELATSRDASRFEGDHEYAFRHALVRDAACALLDANERAAAHLAAATWLEGAGERDPLVLIEHFEKAGRPAQALEHVVRGAERALEGNDFDGAVVLARLAIERGATDALRAQ
ncbi:MAG: AAA family ATPase, partial [Deltaproteobacteria bacterium]